MKKLIFATLLTLLLSMIFMPSTIITSRGQGTVPEAETLAQYIKTNEPKAIKTPSGLYYVITSQGTGEIPKTGQTVVAHYKGTFLDGKEFDADRGQTFSFVLGQHQVITGWDEGFALLKKGAKAKLIIPSSLAYGTQGAGGIIPPNTPLVFEVELVDIK